MLIPKAKYINKNPFVEVTSMMSELNNHTLVFIFLIIKISCHFWILAY